MKYHCQKAITTLELLSSLLVNDNMSTSGIEVSSEKQKRTASQELMKNKSKRAREDKSSTCHSSKDAIAGDSASSHEPPIVRSLVKTRLLIISDTHAAEFSPTNKPFQRADVAIHCGDLTDGSKIDEYRSAIRLLKDLNAPLKLVIAGNHDFTMDDAVYRKNMAETQRLDSSINKELWTQNFGRDGEARKIFEEAKDAGIHFLQEGTHELELGNGARLTVYASPFTPSNSRGELGLHWGFQYHPDEGHDYAIKDGVDIAVTHGPPRGIMDYKQRGCSDLFKAIARARPRVHCFGHVHRSWGAKLVTWKEEMGETPSHFTAIDNNKSILVENLARLRSSNLDTDEDMQKKKEKVARYTQERCCKTSHCKGDADPLRYGEQTLFVNAAFKGHEEEFIQHYPWLVDVELPMACEQTQLADRLDEKG